MYICPLEASCQLSLLASWPVQIGINPYLTGKPVADEPNLHGSGRVGEPAGWILPGDYKR